MNDNGVVDQAIETLRAAVRDANAAQDRLLTAQRALEDAEAAVIRAEKTLDAAIEAAKSGRPGAQIINIGERRSPESNTHGA